jgi:SAM-dependent methyltransferase
VEALFWTGFFLVLLFGFVVFRGAPYVPSKKRDIQKAFDELYQLKAHDTLVDIGSGDGIVLREAARRGAKAVGYELNPALVLLSRLLSRKYPSVKIQMADFWRMKFPQDTTIVYTFGDARDIERMADKVAAEATRLRRELYLVSYGFSLKGIPPVKRAGAHYLYRFSPLQSDQA